MPEKRPILYTYLLWGFRMVALTQRQPAP